MKSVLPPNTGRGVHPSPELRAVIDIGATAIRMALAECGHHGTFRMLESLEQHVNLGRDTFNRGEVGQQTIEDCVQTLRDFMTVLREVGVCDPASIRAVATSAVAEASNRDVLVDRLFMATGIRVEVLAMADINRFIYYSILPLLDKTPELRKGTLLVIEAGGGYTTALALQHGAVLFAHTYRFGSFRTHELLDEAHVPATRFRQLVEEEIRSGIRPVVEQLAGRKEVRVLVLGSEARLAADHLAPGWQERLCTRIRLTDLATLTNRVLKGSVEDTVRTYNLSFSAAESLGPALLMMQMIPRMLGGKSVYTGSSTLRDGLLRETIDGGAWSDAFRRQILHSAMQTARHYRVDQKHARRVASLCSNLFRAMQPEHKMLARYETVLQVAALLHDTGNFISNRSHHKHSQYLIEHSDLFGLGPRDQTIAALTARYHRKSIPKASHRDYAALDHVDRLRVSKLAALLRIADALDRSRSQAILDPSLTLLPDRLEIGVPNPVACAVEEIALREKSTLFEQVYGKRVVLTRAPGKPQNKTP